VTRAKFCHTHHQLYIVTPSLVCTAVYPQPPDLTLVATVLVANARFPKVASGGDSHPLSIQPQGNRQQREDAHQHAKDAKGFGGASLLNPVADEDGPRESDDSTQDGGNDEAVRCAVRVCIDQLLKVSHIGFAVAGTYRSQEYSHS
jgi:hypothetical protein